MPDRNNPTQSESENAAAIARRKLIDAGCELVIEHYEHGTHLREVYAYLNAGAVSKRAGLSRGLLLDNGKRKGHF